MIKGITFDLDDTLYNERLFVESGFKVVAEFLSQEKHFDFGMIFAELIAVLEQDGRGAIFDAVLKKHNAYSLELVARLVERYRFHKPNIELYPGVRSMLDGLKERYVVGLITDGLASVQKNKVKALDIETFFNKIIYTDELGNGKTKPSSYPFQKIADTFRLSPSRIAYIGDNPHKDFIGAKRIGMKTVRIKMGMYKDVIVDDEYEADFSIADIMKLPVLLGSLH